LIGHLATVPLEGGKFKLRGETILSFLTEEGMEWIDNMASQTNIHLTWSNHVIMYWPI